MARFHAGCRQCPHRDDTGTLSSRQTRQLAEIRWRADRLPLFHAEGAGGLAISGVGTFAVHSMAAALGVYLQENPCEDASDQGRNPGRPDRQTLIVLAGDGRPAVAELIAAAIEATRWTGCHAIDIGPASSPCLATAVEELSADGGLLIGNPGLRRHTIGVKFFSHHATPLSRGGLLDRIEQLCQAPIDRPTRKYGPLGRHQAEPDYLADLMPEYHALRPLGFVLDSTCGPCERYLQKLTRSVACRILPCRRHGDGLGQQVVEDRAHFGFRIEDDGEVCGLVDELGRAVPPERLLLLLARFVLPGHAPDSSSKPGSPAAGVVPLWNAEPTSREAMAGAMRRENALLGGDPSGRLWYMAGRTPVPDALRTLTRLLVLLSRSDRPLSEVLDREAPAR